MNALEQLKQYSTVVADTGDVSQIAIFKPQDATTNPSLLYKLISVDPNSDIVREALDYAHGKENPVQSAMDRLAVTVGKGILDIIPGRISTEVPAKLSYDVNGMYRHAQNIIEMYEEMGVDKDRVLIKIASTWEGIQAAEKLETEGIHCNLTLLFGFEQAVACAEAGVTLISPFVGRIYDWHMKNESREIPFTALEDPGVASVTKIFNYFKDHGYETEIMGASFRNPEQILGLAGCDLLTISPKLLKDLEEMNVKVPRVLTPEEKDLKRPEDMDHATFQRALTLNPMAYEKLGEGIRGFAADEKKLEELLKERMGLS